MARTYVSCTRSSVSPPEPRYEHNRQIAGRVAATSSPTAGSPPLIAWSRSGRSGSGFSSLTSRSWRSMDDESMGEPTSSVRGELLGSVHQVGRTESLGPGGELG